MSESPLHILFLSSWYPSRIHPTLGNFVERHAQAIAELHHVTVLYCVAEGGRSNIEVADTQTGNLREVIVYGPKSKNPFTTWNTFNHGVNYIQKDLSQPFEIIHQNIIWRSGWQARVLSRKWNIPYIITEHWTGYSPQRKENHSTLLHVLSKWVVAKASYLCPVSEDLATTMRSFGLRGRYTVVPNVVNTELFQIHEKPKDHLRYLHVSSLQEDHKNITGILTAWKSFSKHNNRAHLTIGGDGPFEHYAGKALEMGIEPSTISFFGTQTEEQIAEKMGTSHALILFSNYENLPVVIVEALSCGMYIISSDVGGIAEHITPERGVLIKPRKIEQLIEALEQSVVQIPMTNKEALREYAIAHFSKRHIAEKFDALYRKAIAEHP